MKLISNYLSRTKKIVAASALVLAMAAFTVIGTAHASNVSFPGTATDCDANAVVYCGGLTAGTVATKYNNGDGHNSAASIHNIFNAYGISSSDMSGLTTNAQAGYVTKTGNVYVGNELVATGAMTGGRQNMAGSTQASYGGTTFYKRTPSVSFRSNSLKAYVVMKNGVFDFAILSACGNPVTATPKKPNYDIIKDVRAKGESTWHNSVTVKSGAHVEYRVTVKSTGAVAATNIKVTDTMPSNTKYISGSLKRSDGGSVTGFFSTGNLISTLAPNKTVVYTFEAIIGSSDNTSTCKPQTLVNTGRMTSPGLPNDSDTANVDKTCAPQPAYACTDLALTIGENRTVTAKVTYTKSAGVTLKSISYDFGDKTSPVVVTSDTQTHQYTADGKYTVTATPTFTVNGKDIASPSSACSGNVDFSTPPVTPPTPPVTPPELPKTGAGAVIGLFGAVAAAGTFGHRFLTRRQMR